MRSQVTSRPSCEHTVRAHSQIRADIRPTTPPPHHFPAIQQRVSRESNALRYRRKYKSISNPSHRAQNATAITCRTVDVLLSVDQWRAHTHPLPHSHTHTHLVVPIVRPAGRNLWGGWNENAIKRNHLGLMMIWFSVIRLTRVCQTMRIMRVRMLMHV